MAGRKIDKSESHLKAKPCPWCSKTVKAQVRGSYVKGWVAFVECFNCDARGPTKRSSSYSNDEYVIEDQAIESWNRVIENYQT